MLWIGLKQKFTYYCFCYYKHFLIYNIQGEMSKQKETQIIDSKHLNDVEQYLNDNGIKLNTHVPEEIISLPMLMVRYKNFDSNKMAKELLGDGYSKKTESLDFSGLKKEIFKKNAKELIIEGKKKLIYKNMSDEGQNCNLDEKTVVKISNDFLKQYKLMQDDIILDQIYYGVEKHICSEPVYKLVYNQTYKNKFLGESYIHTYVNDRE